MLTLSLSAWIIPKEGASQSLPESHLLSDCQPTEHHRFDMLTFNSPPLVIFKDRINSCDSVLRIIHKWTVHLGKILSQCLVDLQYGILASTIVTQSLKFLDRLLSHCSNTALANSAALGWLRYSEGLKRNATTVAQVALSVSTFHYGAVFVVAGIVVIALLPITLIFVASVPLLVPIFYFLRVTTHLAEMNRKAALEVNSKACVVLHPLPWEIRTIRIITIQPGFPGDPIICDLHIGSFEAENYEALSYVWGPANFTRKILISGKPVYVTNHLYHAMKHLRQRDKPRSIWIDALCIDQNDPDDRARQVSQMRQIYESATRVVIWLGSSPWCLEDAFSRAKQRPTPIVYNYGTVRAVSKLLRRGWWQRVWVVQELVVAREVMVQCDSVSLPWDSFVQLVETCMRMPWFRDRGTFVDEYHALKHYRETRLQDINPDYGLLSFVYAFRQKMASEPRDKIYAFLGLVRPQDPSAFSIPPDYKLSHTSLCHSFAVNCIRETQSLNILAYAQGLNPDFLSVRGRRSWCPYWYSNTGARQPTPLWDGGLDTPATRYRWMHSFSASGRNSAAIWKLRENDALGARGLFLDSIIAVGTTLDPSVLEYIDSYSRTSTTTSPTTSLRRHIRYKMNPKRVFSHWRTMVTGASGRPEEDIMKIFHQTLTAGLYDHIPDSVEKASEYYSVRDDICMHRTLFFTESGGFGVGPWNTRRGDKLAVLLGCDVPVVLRNINGTDSPAEPGLDIESLEAQNLYQTDLADAYKYVGQAYVHDRMV